MKGKHVLISGGTSGIGRATALALARQGAVVTIIGRNEHKSRETVDAIRAQTGNPQVAYLLADLSSTAQTLAAGRCLRDQKGGVLDRRWAAEGRASHDPTPQEGARVRECRRP